MHNQDQQQRLQERQQHQQQQDPLRDVSSDRASTEIMPIAVDNVIHIQPQPEVSYPHFMDFRQDKYKSCQGPEKKTSVRGDSCYELQFDFEISPQNEAAEESSHNIQKQQQQQKQREVWLPQQIPLHQQENQTLHKPSRNLGPEAGHQLWPLRQEEQQHRQEQCYQSNLSGAAFSSQDSLNDVDLENLASQPLFSQWSTVQAQKHQRSTEESIEIIGEDSQTYCSPPLDLSPDNDTYALLSQMGRKTTKYQGKATIEDSHQRETKTDCGLNSSENRASWDNVGNQEIYPCSVMRSVPVELYGTDESELDQSIVVRPGSLARTQLEKGPSAQRNTSGSKLAIQGKKQKSSMNESFTKLAWCTDDLSTSSCSSSSLSAFKKNLQDVEQR